MKKIYSFGFLIFILILNVTDSEAQCPPGYTPVTINMDVNGCPYEVDLCYKCSPLGAIPGAVNVIGVTPLPMTPPCAQTWTIQQVVLYITLHVSSYDYFYTYLCGLPNSVPPCPDQSDEIETKHYNCWQVTLIEYFGEQVYYYEPCDTTVYCLEKYTWCYDESLNEYRKTLTFGPVQIGSPSCKLEAGEIILPTIVGETSPCFILHNVCM